MTRKYYLPVAFNSLSSGGLGSESQSLWCPVVVKRGVPLTVFLWLPSSETEIINVMTLPEVHSEKTRLDCNLMCLKYGTFCGL